MSRGKPKVYCFVTNDRYELMISLPLPLKDFCDKYKIDKTYALYCAGKGANRRHQGLYKIIAFHEEEEHNK